MAAPAPAPHGRMVTVTVNPKLAKMTEPEIFHISKKNNDQVNWVAADPAISFTVEFNEESPFYDKDFDSHAYPYSGLVRRNLQADSKKAYKYTVTAGGRTVDPGGIIDP
jgi:hypothetical protein